MIEQSKPFYEEFTVNEDHLSILNRNHELVYEIREKINKRHVFYMYQQAEEIIRDELDPRFQDADIDVNNRGRILFLYGDFNTGKSYLLRYAMALLHQRYINIWQANPTLFPIQIINLRDDINTAKQFLLFLLAQLGRPVDPIQLKNWEKTHIEEVRLQERLINLLESYQTRILVLDECQRLLKARNPNIPNIFECIKDLTTKSNWSGPLRTNFVLCGTQDGLPLLDAADWIQGRAHTIKLQELSQMEYGHFLWTIYTDYISLGISTDWDMAIFDSESNDYVLNPELASFLYQRSNGKAGLTVEIIRDAIKRSLNRGKLFPTQEDYRLVLLEGRTYEKIKLEKVEKPETDRLIEITVEINDRYCKIEKCLHFRKPFKQYPSLIRHYKIKHPEVVILTKEGERI